MLAKVQRTRGCLICTRAAQLSASISYFFARYLCIHLDRLIDKYADYTIKSKDELLLEIGVLFAEMP